MLADYVLHPLPKNQWNLTLWAVSLNVLPHSHCQVQSCCILTVITRLLLRGRIQYVAGHWLCGMKGSGVDILFRLLGTICLVHSLLMACYFAMIMRLPLIPHTVLQLERMDWRSTKYMCSVYQLTSKFYINFIFNHDHMHKDYISCLVAQIRVEPPVSKHK